MQIGASHSLLHHGSPSKASGQMGSLVGTQGFHSMFCLEYVGSILIPFSISWHDSESNRGSNSLK